MPVIGWWGGLAFRELIAGFDHWLAFGLLLLVGGRMIHDAVRADSCSRGIRLASLPTLLMLSVATSIDAMAVGLSFSLLGVSILVPVIVIGTVTWALSLAGVYLGRYAGDTLQNRAQILGGLILIGIGTRILWHHLAPGAAVPVM